MSSSHGRPPIRNITSGMAVGSAGVFTSRISGLVRDILFARYWGTGDTLGAFFVAFTIPNLFRRILGEGALAEAFIPLFAEKSARDGRPAAMRFAANVVAIVGTVLVGITGIGIGVAVLAAGMVVDEFGRTTLRMVPWLLPYSIFICIAGILAAILNSARRFAVPALSSVILNLAFIIAVVAVCPNLGPGDVEQSRGLAGAVLVAGVIQVAMLIPQLQQIGLPMPRLPDFRSPDIGLLTRRTLPGVFGASVNQVNVLCDRLFAAWLGGYAVTSLYYSERLVYLPIGLFAVALATACLPEFSRAVSNKRTADLVDASFYAVRLILYLTTPCVLALMVLGGPIVEVLFRRGSFDGDSVRFTVSALLFYAPGIPAFAAAKILRSVFFSRGDMATPVKIAMLCMVLNVILNLLFILPLQHRGLALATTVSAYANCLILGIVLFRALRTEQLPIGDLARSVARIVAATAVSGVIMHACHGVLQPSVAAGLMRNMIAVAVPVAAGIIVYLVVSRVLGAREPGEFGSALGSAIRRRA